MATLHPYTFRTWEQVERWIRDNNLIHWEFNVRDRDNEESKGGAFVVNSDWYEGDIELKLNMTRKQLEAQPGRYLYGKGLKTMGQRSAPACCELFLGADTMAMPQWGNPYQQPTQPVAGVSQEPIDKEALKNEIREQLRYEFDRAKLDEERKRFEEERKQFDADKSSVVGALVGYLAPVAQAISGNLGKTRIAGVDVPGGRAALSVPDTDGQPVEDTPAEEQEIFTDAENEELYDLLTRFKKIEPDYMTMLRRVVEMAEQGDATYTMAKQFLTAQQ